MKTILASSLSELLKAANLDQRGSYQHYVNGVLPMKMGLSEAPLYLQRAVMQAAFAAAVSEEKNGMYDETVLSAVSYLLNELRAQGAITKAAAAKAEEMLLPLRDAAKAYTVHMVGHAHIDMNWQWPFHETVSVTLETFRTVLRFMREDSSFTFSQSQASTYRIVEEYEPEMLKEIAQRVKEGRWEISASTWVEADKNMPSEESMARHLLYTKKYLSRLFDIKEESLNLDFEPDTFGHGENVPEILAMGGVKYYYYCRGHKPTGAHIWQAPSGNSVLCYQEPTWYLGDVNPNFALFVPKHCGQTGIMDSIKVYGVGDHGGGPTRQDITYIHEMSSWPVFPTLKFSTYRAFFEKLEAVRGQLPVVRQELNCVFPGCYTTQCRVKAANRAGEDTLQEAELLSAVASAKTGKQYPSCAYEGAWRKILFSQFHDILTGSGVRDTREYAMATFSEALAAAGTNETAAMHALAEKIDTSTVQENGVSEFTRSGGAGVGFGSMRFRPPVAERCATRTRVFHLFNSLDTNRVTPTELTVWDYPVNAENICARALSGEKLPVQLLSQEGGIGYMGHSYVKLLVGVKIPAMGYQTVILDAPENPEEFRLCYPGDPRLESVENYILENEFLRAEFDRESGALRSLINKENGKEMLAAPTGFFDILEDPARGMTSWVVGRYLNRKLIQGSARLKKGANGELRQSFTMETPFATSSKLFCEISLDKNARALQYHVSVDWREKGGRENGVAQLAFGALLNYESGSARFDNAAGCIDRAPLEMDVPARTYGCALNKSGEGSVFLTSDAKHGMRFEGNRLQLTLIRAGFQPDPDPENGKHEFTLSLGVIMNTSGLALAREASLLNRPSAAITMRPHKGSEQGEGSYFAHSAADSARVTAVKFAENEKLLAIRLVNYGEETEIRLKTPVCVKKAYLSDICEHKGRELPLDGAYIRIPLRRKAMETVLAEW